MDNKKAFSALERIAEIDKISKSSDEDTAIHAPEYHQLVSELRDYIKNLTVDNLLRLYHYTKNRTLYPYQTEVLTPGEIDDQPS